MDTFGYNKIDDYLLGRLDGEELKAFEQKLQTDMDFAKTVAQQKQAMNLIGKVGDMEMKREVQEVQQKFQQKKKPVSIFRRLRPLLAVASVLLLLLVSYWLFQGPSDEQLFEKYYTAYNTGYGDRDANDPAAIKLAEASQFYKQKEYAKALLLFESLPDIKDSKLKMMTGISHLELNDYEKANQLFMQLFNEKDPVFQYHGLWYSSMTYLKAGDIEKAKTQLEQLIQAEDPNGVYNQEKAEALLKKL